MRWFGLGKRQVQHDPGVQQTLLHELRQRFGAQVQVPFRDQAAAAAALLDGDDGLAVAAAVLRDFADQAHADLLAQAADLHRRTGHGLIVDRRDYRPLWETAAAQLRWSLFALPGGLHPYAQVAAAVTVVGGQARRAVRVSDPEPLLAHVFEILDLTFDGWEFGRVLVDVDAATFAGQLIAAATDLRAAMGDPPPLPSPVRELMRRNNTVDVYDAATHRVVGGFNPGKTMRESFLT